MKCLPRYRVQYTHSLLPSFLGQPSSLQAVNLPPTLAVKFEHPHFLTVNPPNPYPPPPPTHLLVVLEGREGDEGRKRGDRRGETVEESRESCEPADDVQRQIFRANIYILNMLQQ